MTRSEPRASVVSAVIVGQGDLPRALLDSARAIVPDADDVVAISNSECSIDGLAPALEAALQMLPAGSVVVFADMFGSSCANASRDVVRNHPRVTVVCGVNLPMLVRFLHYRRRKPLAELVPFLLETGKSAVRTLEV